MSSNRVSVFNSPSNSDAVKICRDAMGVSILEDGTPVLHFAPHKGQGYGAQLVPVAELPEFLDALEGYANGVERHADSTPTATDMLHATIATVEGDNSIVTFKLSGARGSKSTKIAISDIRGVVNMIRGSMPRINEIAGIVTPSGDSDESESE